MTSYSDRELTLEALMSSLGADRYRNAVKRAKERGRETTHAPGRMLLAEACTAMEQAVHDWRASTIRHPVQRENRERLADLPDPLLAALTCKVLLDSISLERDYAMTARSIAKAIEDNARFEFFKREAPRIWRRLKHQFRNADGYAAKRRKIMMSMRRAGLQWDPWPHSEILRIGVSLLELFIQSTGLVYTRVVYKAGGGFKSKRLHVVPNDATLKWLEESHEAHTAMFPFYLPMVQKPEEWASIEDGGYASDLVCKVPFIKIFNAKAVKEAEEANLGEVFNAVNAIQGTAWELNEDVYQVVSHFWEQSTQIADMPSREDLPLPPKPADMETNEEARKKWRRSSARVYEANVALRSQRVQTSRIMFMARQFSRDALGDSPFYFPHTCDFRGRIYPVPYFLQPQGPSLARGLLRFANGKPIGSEANQRWFLIHGANCFGYDKASLAERMAWVIQNEKKILAVHDDPIDCRWWADADKPWEFLAWCLEYGEWKADPAFVSKIAVSMDGSNNGLQIFSLLLRDQVGGFATNCMPTDWPQDIYQTVADKVTALLQADLQATHEDPRILGWAKGWLEVCGGAIPRACTKRSVMTLPYGATRYSCQRYILEWYHEAAKHLPFGNEEFRASWYLSGLIWRAIGETVIAARQGMAWLQQVARLLAEEDQAVIWTAPSGFPVRQEYFKETNRCVATAIGDKIRRTWIVNPTSRLSKKRQVNGIAPNFVHSLDAAALVKTVNACVEKGINSYAMVHDSFGCLAGDADTLSRTLREEYASMFEQDILGDFKRSLEPLGIELPPLPQYGTLDPKELKNSVYFFA